MTLTPVFVTEFKDTTFQHTLANVANPEFNWQRMRRYVSPFFLNGILQMGAFDDKFEAILAVDTAMAVIQTFADSHKMTAQNLMNMYLADELSEQLPDVLLVTIYSLMLGHRQAPHDLPPAFFAMVLSQLIESSNDINKPTFKKLQSRAEDILAKNVYTNLDKMTPEAKARFATFLALFLS